MFSETGQRQFSVDPMTPLFSLERTSSQLSQRVGSSSQMGYSWGTQTSDVRNRKSGLLRGTQQVSWTQTQALTDPLESWIDNLSSQTNMQYSNNSNENNSSEGIALPMSPPVSLPSTFNNKNLIIQRVPTRFGRSTSSNYEFRADKEENFRLAAHAKRATKVVVYRQYRQGELPDICIPLSDVWRPLMALCLSDSNIASTTFLSLFECVYRSIASTDRSSSHRLRKTLRDVLNECIGASGGSNTQFVACILSCCLSCLSQEDLHTGIVTLDAPDTITHLSGELIEHVSIRSRNYHIGIQCLEEKLLIMQQQATQLDGYNVSDDLLLKGKKDNIHIKKMKKEMRTVWMALSKLYTGLGEYDILLGVCNRISSFESTKYALDAEISGDFPKAIELYNSMIEQINNGEACDDVSSDEIELWNDRSLECLRNLLDWNQLYEKTSAVCNNDSLLQDRRLRERFLPKHFQCIINIDSQENTTLNEFMQKTLHADNRELLSWAEDCIPAELATCSIIQKDWIKARGYTEACYDQFLTGWNSLHRCAYAAKTHLLQSLQRSVEQEDTLTLHSQSSSITRNDVLTLINRSV